MKFQINTLEYGVLTPMTYSPNQSLKKFLQIVDEGWFTKKPGYQEIATKLDLPVEMVQQIFQSQNPLNMLYEWTMMRKLTYFQFYNILQALYLRDK